MAHIGTAFLQLLQTHNMNTHNGCNNHYLNDVISTTYTWHTQPVCIVQKSLHWCHLIKPTTEFVHCSAEHAMKQAVTLLHMSAVSTGRGQGGVAKRIGWSVKWNVNVILELVAMPAHGWDNGKMYHFDGNIFKNLMHSTWECQWANIAISHWDKTITRVVTIPAYITANFETSTSRDKIFEDLSAKNTMKSQQKYAVMLSAQKQKRSSKPTKSMTALLRSEQNFAKDKLQFLDS